jgi:hypothetical protein
MLLEFEWKFTSLHTSSCCWLKREEWTAIDCPFHPPHPLVFVVPLRQPSPFTSSRKISACTSSAPSLSVAVCSKEQMGENMLVLLRSQSVLSRHLNNGVKNMAVWARPKNRMNRIYPLNSSCLS